MKIKFYETAKPLNPKQDRMNLKSIKYIYSKIRLNKKVSKLDTLKTGTEDGMAYIQTKDGMVFYGIKSAAKDRKYYNLLSNRAKKRIPFSCYQLACDIIIRYHEGGLKYGGPRKELFYNVKKGDVIAEMGAYMGHYTLYLSKKAGNSGKVIAIEPMPDNVSILKRNILSNAIENVVVVPKGVWKQKDEMTFNRRKGDNQSGSLQLSYDNSSELKVEVNSLDNILAEQNIKHVNFMLIQLNGVEIEALEGLIKTKPLNMAIAARYKKDGKDAAPLIKEILVSRGYIVTIVNKDYVFAKLS